MSAETAGPVAYDNLPRRYHRWKWQVLISFCAFYLFVYTGRFNFWPTSPLIKDDLQLTNIEIGVINAMLLWGFAAGDLVHGRMSEAYGLRLWVMLGAALTTVFNWAASFGTSAVSFAIPWGLAGFVNAACWSPAISMISQWWPRRERGIAMGILGTVTGGAMLLMWWLSSWVAAEWGWRAAFRYPPLIILTMGVAFYFLTRDRPRDVGLPEYIEEDEISAAPESVSEEELKGLGPYKWLLTNSRFQLACHVKGLENVARYGLTTWVPLYYFEAGGLDITQTVFITFLLPLGYLIAPPLAGFISDKLLGSRRRPLVVASCFLSAAALVAIAIAPPSNAWLGAALMLWGGVSMGVSLILHHFRGPVRAQDGRHGGRRAGRPRLSLCRGAGHDLQRAVGHGGQPVAHRLPGHGRHPPDFRRHDQPRAGVAQCCAPWDASLTAAISSPSWSA